VTGKQYVAKTEKIPAHCTQFDQFVHDLNDHHDAAQQWRSTLPNVACAAMRPDTTKLISYKKRYFCREISLRRH